MNINKIFNPKSVAIVGASETKTKWGYQILKNLIDAGFPGNIYPINPKSQTIEDLVVYKSLYDVQDKNIEMAVICVPARFVSGIMEECGQTGIKSVIIISANFSETGNFEMEQLVVCIAEIYGINFVGPNTFGVINKASKLNVSLISTGEL